MIAAGLHASWRDVDMAAWAWPHFTPRELACRCGKHCDGEYFHLPPFLDALERLRGEAGALVVNSGRRCPIHNAEIGGASLSQHKVAVATDISLAKHEPVQLARLAARAGFAGLGFGVSFLHLDMRVRPPSWPGLWRVPNAFHYPGGEKAWTARFGFDPVPRFQKTGGLNG